MPEYTHRGNGRVENALGETRTEAEQRVGRMLSRKAMAEGIVEHMAEELGKQYKVTLAEKLIADDDDPRKWMVQVTPLQYSALVIEENFWDFPTDNLRAQLMLLSKG